uniref:Uncharacterized protein n=1 Tax=Globodera rostochiensis TaxID=31243 RepID=A0A914HF99_GLORO
MARSSTICDDKRFNSILHLKWVSVTQLCFLAHEECPQDAVILHDIHRTFPAHEYYKESNELGQKSLYRISKANEQFFAQFVEEQNTKFDEQQQETDRMATAKRRETFRKMKSKRKGARPIQANCAIELEENQKLVNALQTNIVGLEENQQNLHKLVALLSEKPTIVWQKLDELGIDCPTRWRVFEKWTYQTKYDSKKFPKLQMNNFMNAPYSISMIKELHKLAMGEEREAWAGNFRGELGAVEPSGMTQGENCGIKFNRLEEMDELNHLNHCQRSVFELKTREKKTKRKKKALMNMMIASFLSMPSDQKALLERQHKQSANSEQKKKIEL